MLLLTAQFIYNNIKNGMTNSTPFTILYRYKPKLTRKTKSIKIIVEKIRILII